MSYKALLADVTKERAALQLQIKGLDKIAGVLQDLNGSTTTATRAKGTRAKSQAASFVDRAKERTVARASKSRSQLTEAKVRRIRKLLADKYDVGSIAAEYGVSYSTVYNIWKRHTWRDVRA